MRIGPFLPELSPVSNGRVRKTCRKPLVQIAPRLQRKVSFGGGRLVQLHIAIRDFKSYRSVIRVLHDRHIETASEDGTRRYSTPAKKSRNRKQDGYGLARRVEPSVFAICGYSLVARDPTRANRGSATSTNVARWLACAVRNLRARHHSQHPPVAEGRRRFEFRHP